MPIFEVPEYEKKRAQELIEAKKIKATAMLADQIEWTPQEKQKAFLECQADEVLYGGAAGGGKSEALLMYSIIRRLTYPGTRGLILRRTVAELMKQGSLIPRAKEILGTKWKWRERDKTYTAPNGSVIEFGHCDTEADVYRWQSSQYEDICFDEATHFTEFQIRYISSRCRSAKAGMPGIPNKFCPNPPPLKPQIRFASNPGNVGHTYFRKKFIDGHKPGEIWTPEPTPDDPEPKSRCFIPATIYDNQILMKADPGYLAWLRQLPERERKMLLEGEWNLSFGQFFDEWNPEVHVVEPFTIPKHWPVFAGMDWGYNHPTVVLWAAMSPDGVLYVFEELRVRFLHVEELANRILKRPTPVVFGAGPDVFSWQKEHLGGRSIAQQFSEFGVFLSNVTAGKKRYHMWEQVRHYLQWRDEKGEQMPGRPLLRVFKTCKHLINAIPDALANPNDPEDVLRVDIDPTTGLGGDDEVTALGYLAMTRPFTDTEFFIETPPPGSFEWHMSFKKPLDKSGIICYPNPKKIGGSRP
jgi:hypothetical protein